MDMINTTSSQPPPPEPPLPPSPTLIRRKKAKSVTFPASPGSDAARSSKPPADPIAAAVPLPETPASSSLAVTGAIPAVIEPPVSSKESREVAGPGQLGYFSAAELVPSGEAFANPNVSRGSFLGDPVTPAFFTPMSQLPPVSLEGSQPPVEPPVAIEQEAETAPAIEEHEVEAAPATEEQEPANEPDVEPVVVAEAQGDLAGSPPPMLHVAPNPIPTVLASQPAIFIGISGCPSSGKTTLAHLLSEVLPPSTPSFIVHQADFFVSEHLMVPQGEEAATHRHTVDFASFKRFLEYSKREGRPPPAFRSTQPMVDRERALSQVPSPFLEQRQSGLGGMQCFQSGRPVGIVEGGMLYHSETIRSLLDIKILLRAGREESRSRRFDGAGDDHERRAWDTGEYFDRIMWPGYVNEHAVLFDNTDVEGRPKFRMCERVGISVQPTLNMGLEETLRWIVDIICRESEEIVYRHDREMASALDTREEFEFCDCSEGFLGKIRKTIFDHL
ncbi:MAG: hypothetical protein Q9182_001561 [Xanthomendoza sp. 2 TL-2023]